MATAKCLYVVMITCNGQITKHVMARIQILDLMPHSICSLFNRIWMKDSYLVVLLVFGT